MRSDKSSLPIKDKRSFPHVLAILPSSRLQLPGARIVFSIYVHEDGVPEVLSATLRFEWPENVEVAKTLVCDDGVAVLGIDRSGRVASIEATSYAAGPVFVPEVIEEAGKHHAAMIHALATLWIQWAVVQAFYRSCAAALPHPVIAEGHPRREWMTTSSSAASTESVW
jgi:hypothetical protein